MRCGNLCLPGSCFGLPRPDSSASTIAWRHCVRATGRSFPGAMPRSLADEGVRAILDHHLGCSSPLRSGQPRNRNIHVTSSRIAASAHCASLGPSGYPHLLSGAFRSLGVFAVKTGRNLGGGPRFAAPSAAVDLSSQALERCLSLLVLLFQKPQPVTYNLARRCVATASHLLPDEVLEVVTECIARWHSCNFSTNSTIILYHNLISTGAGDRPLLQLAQRSRRQGFRDFNNRPR